LLLLLGSEALGQRQTLTIPLLTQSNASVQCIVTRGASAPATAVAFSPDGTRLAAAAYQEALLWDLTKAALGKRLGGCSGTVQSLAFSPDGKLLAVGDGLPGRSGALRLFAVETGQSVACFQEPKDVVYSVAFSPDGKRIAAGAADHSAYLWSVEQQKLVATLRDHNDRIWGVAFSADGKFLATASADRTARLWEAGSWKSLARMEQAESVQGVAFSADGQWLALAVAGAGERTVRIRRRDNAQTVRTIEIGAAKPSDVLWAAKGNRLYVPCSDGTIRVFDAGNGSALATLSGHNDWVHCVAVAADGATIASGSADGVVKLWSADGWKPLATLLQLAPRSDEWLLVSAAGYLQASSPGKLEWKTTNVKMPTTKLAVQLHNAERTRQAIAGKNVPPPPLE